MTSEHFLCHYVTRSKHKGQNRPIRHFPLSWLTGRLGHASHGSLYNAMRRWWLDQASLPTITHYRKNGFPESPGGSSLLLLGFTGLPLIWHPKQVLCIGPWARRVSFGGTSGWAVPHMEAAAQKVLQTLRRSSIEVPELQEELEVYSGEECSEKFSQRAPFGTEQVCWYEQWGVQEDVHFNY